MISGFATPEGTLKFAENSGALLSNFKRFENLTLSNVGMGTYLGDADDRTDTLVKDAIKQSLTSGINVIDTAINYRSQKAERTVGKAVSELIDANHISRDQIFISTKNGYVTNDADIKQDFWEYVKTEYASKGIVKEGDITSGYHCMTTAYLDDQLKRSLKNMNLDCIDLMYLHNAVEGQIRDVPKEKLLQNLQSTFEFYEQKRTEGKIRFYGMATWECFRVASDNPQYLSLKEILDMAKKAGGEKHGLRFVQLPFNLYYDQALLTKNQPQNGDMISFLNAASLLGVGVFTSVPFMQGRLLSPGVMPEFSDDSPALRALQFIRSCPGVLAPLAGQKLPEHVSENLKIMKIPPLLENDFVSLVKKLTS